MILLFCGPLPFGLLDPVPLLNGSTPRNGLATMHAKVNQQSILTVTFGSMRGSGQHLGLGKTARDSPDQGQAGSLYKGHWDYTETLKVAVRQSLISIGLVVALLSTSFESKAVEASKPLAYLLSSTKDVGNPDLSEKYSAYASKYDKLDNGWIADLLDFQNLRTDLISKARGKVLEVGVGTGLNLPLYSLDASAQVSSVLGIDVSPGMLQQAQLKIAELKNAKADTSPEFVLEQMDVMDMSALGSGQFDTVLDTFSLCVFQDPEKALIEMKRVMKPSVSSRLFLLEHSASDNIILSSYQDITAPLVAAAAKQCMWNQRVVDLVESAGFRIIHTSKYLGGTVVMIEAAPQ